MFLIIILGSYKIFNLKKYIFIGSTAKNRFQIRIVQQKMHNLKEKKAIFW